MTVLAFFVCTRSIGLLAVRVLKGVLHLYEIIGYGPFRQFDIFAILVEETNLVNA